VGLTFKRQRVVVAPVGYVFRLMKGAQQAGSDVEAVFPGGGTAGATLRATDWSTNPLGSVDKWPASLRAIVRLMLNTRQATCLFLGPELINLYNDGFIPLLGEKHPRAMGQRAQECWSDAWPVVGDLLAGVVTEGKAVLFAEMLIPIVRQGRLEDAWWNYSYSPAFDDSGAIAGVLVVATETTAEVVARRRESGLRKAAEAANQAKDEFLATISHELRNPLGAILGWTRMLARKRDPERLSKGLAVIERNALAQARLIEDILDVSRITSGKVVLEPRRVALGSVIQHAVESIRPAASAKGIRLVLALEEGAVDVIADENRLQQIVWNLLSNAVKFTAAGGEVRVGAERVGSRVAIRVEDTGVGISPEFLPHVFDRFRQADASTTRSHGGLGLGLAIVRHLVELHDGTVSASSAGVGRGATFEVTLPMSAVEPADGPARLDRQSKAEANTRGRALLAGVRVLVVDDEDDARELVTIVLQEAGAKVTAASSVAAALEILRSTQVAVMVSDLGMPSQDGYSFIQQLRLEGPLASRNIPALALSAYAHAEDRRRALKAGFQEYAAKPVAPDALVLMVAALAGGERRTGSKANRERLAEVATVGSERDRLR
jgi:signal transduction histidine kinase/FixJ family two-component response regulator